MILVASQQKLLEEKKGLQELESQVILSEGLHVIYAIWESK